MSVSATLRIEASRAAQLTAAIDDVDRSTPTKMPRCVSELDIIGPRLGGIGSFTHDRRTTFAEDQEAVVTDLLA
jgi:hypothetical protein